jgi:hypothetical protein
MTGTDCDSPSRHGVRVSLPAAAISIAAHLPQSDFRPASLFGLGPHSQSPNVNHAGAMVAILLFDKEIIVPSVNLQNLLIG